MSTKNFFMKWWIYQKERFPLLQYVPLVAAFSFCAVSYSAIIRDSIVSWQAFLVSFVTSLSFFMLLRIADEFKDFEEDSKYRSYRPVPRGLVKLKELAVIGLCLSVIQFAAAYLYYPRLIFLLAAVWVYFGLMSTEFFVPRWLKAHPFTYLWSHMLVMPLIDFYATACDWLPAEGGAHSAAPLVWFLIASFFNGAVIEIGRKIRCKDDEEEGVETYTFLLGNKKAVAAWLAAMSLSLITAVIAGLRIDFLFVVLAVLTVIYIICIGAGIQFIKAPTSKNAGRFEKLSGVWTLLMYLVLGFLPMLVKIMRW